MKVRYFNYFVIILIFISTCIGKREKVYVSEFQGLYVYEEPELSSRILYRVPYKEPVEILEEREDRWKKIGYSGVEGFSYSPVLSQIRPDQYLFVDSLDGLGVYDKPSSSSNLLALIVHKTRLKVLFIDQGNNMLKKLYWAYVEGENLKGYVKIDFLSKEPRTYYYSIVSSAGVNLRSKPGLDSPVITVLPINLIGEILEKSSEKENIKGTNGYWFRTEYRGKVGWIFSGFTVTSRDKKYLEDRDYIRNEEWFMRYMDSALPVEAYSFDEKDLKDFTVDTYERGNFEIFYINYGNPREDCTVSYNSRIVFKNKLTGIAYSIQGLYAETLIHLDQPFPNTVYSSYEACNCCCPDNGNLLYFIMEDKVMFIHYKEKDSVAMCLYGSVEGIELQRENRYDFTTKTIYMNLKLPLCEVPKDPNLERVPPSGIVHNLFAIVHWDNETITIEKFYDKGIPESYYDLWDRATKNPFGTPQK
ncbi:MAG: SH3 domain-containing protein [Leptospiraceae bacterium]|nr:SH3 domain-containing protein [Leptospiraceae bacterium]MCP5512152.1 SH3 domain-containing protein [Leptospiraceae bacterium]